jgi:hypothetical protein
MRSNCGGGQSLQVQWFGCGCRSIGLYSKHPWSASFFCKDCGVETNSVSSKTFFNNIFLGSLREGKIGLYIVNIESPIKNC